MEKVIKFKTQQEQRVLFGPRDRFLRMIRDHYQVRMSVRNSKLRIEGNEENVANAQIAIMMLLDYVRSQNALSVNDVENVIFGMNMSENSTNVPEDGWEKITSSRTLVNPMTPGQREYIEAIINYDVVFSIGPAGTGKTFLATGMAVEALHKKKVRKIVLVRPAVEAGEKLGFLPGDMQEKINPYLRPVFDALENLLEYGALKRYIERDIIEVAPLAFMRGRTLDNAFIILDEAQNTTPKQMKMFLTRFGRNSKVIVTGDITQIDLEKGDVSGLVDAMHVLKNIDGIKFIHLTDKDIVRHPLVQKIVNAYEKTIFDKAKNQDNHKTEIDIIETTPEQFDEISDENNLPEIDNLDNKSKINNDFEENIPDSESIN